jgi:hypothetical protein
MKNKRLSQSMKKRWKCYYIKQFYSIVSKQTRDFDGGYLQSVFESDKNKMSNKELRSCIRVAKLPNSKFGITYQDWKFIFDIDTKYQFASET